MDTQGDKSDTRKDAAIPQTLDKKNKPNPPPSGADQWEQWKTKDEQLVDGHFEAEMQQAILLSKLDYEEKQELYNTKPKVIATEPIAEPAAAKKKQKKKNIMSLDQFHTAALPTANGGEAAKSKKGGKPKKGPPVRGDTEFFKRVQEDAKAELLKDKIKERIRQQRAQPDEGISRVQLMDTLERQAIEITGLQQKMLDLEKELLLTRAKNKRLSFLLAQGEMKEKAEVLMEVERLQGVQAELNAELATLHTDLEKERSRHAADARPKDKKKKPVEKEK